jgi:GNAT superfamily N-acetyltransferase
MHEIPTHQHQIITPLLGAFANYPVVNAVIEGNSPGRIFVDAIGSPQSAFVLTYAGFSYLLGAADNARFNESLEQWLKAEIFPALAHSDDPTLIFYPLADGWEQPLKAMLEGYPVYDLFRRQFSFHSDRLRGPAEPPAGFALKPIDQRLLDQTGADMFPWESPQAFLEKGFGFWLMKGDEIVSECRSVFRGGGAVEIDIHTDDEYQRQGFGALTASAFIAECLARGLRPNWECWWENEASTALAQKLGYEPVKDYPVFLVELE